MVHGIQLRVLVTSLLILAAACSTSTGGPSGEGGSSGVGGTTGAGGVTDTGGASGGATSSGGTTGASGTPGTGGAKGGATGVGGTIGACGAPAAGGAPGTAAPRVARPVRAEAPVRAVTRVGRKRWFERLQLERGPLRPVRRGEHPVRGSFQHSQSSSEHLQGAAVPGQERGTNNVFKGNQPAGTVGGTTGGTTQDIGATADGFADSAAQDAFCGTGTCTFSRLYDQSGKGNDLTQSPAGTYEPGPDYEVPASHSLTVGGHKVYSVYFPEPSELAIRLGAVRVWIQEQQDHRRADGQRRPGSLHVRRWHACWQRVLLRLRKRRNEQWEWTHRRHGGTQPGNLLLGPRRRKRAMVRG